MTVKRFFYPLRALMLALLFVGAVVTFTSCDDNDEPAKQVVDYYLNVEEQFLVDGSAELADRYYSPTTRMMEAIRKVYPAADTQGKDEAVLEACNKEYDEYCKMYTGYGKHFTCLFHLVRAVKVSGIVKQSETLNTYIYDINPGATDITE